MTAIAVRQQQSEGLVRVWRRVLAALGAPLEPGVRVLDFGCGRGELVVVLRNLGIEADGVDLLDDFAAIRDAVPSAPRPVELAACVHALDPSAPTLPYPDGSFDLVLSNQVFEHVADYPAAIGEIFRVLKPGGACFLVLPARWRLIEAHTFVPLAGVLRARWYLRLWAILGVRNEFQRGLTRAQIADANERFLASQTNYLSRRQIEGLFRERFQQVSFVEAALIRHGDRPLYRLVTRLSLAPLAGWLIRSIWFRALFVRRGCV